jgi:hypothetical protein
MRSGFGRPSGPGFFGGRGRSPQRNLVGFDGTECVADALVVDTGVEISPSALTVSVDVHETLSSERREIARDAAVSIAVGLALLLIAPNPILELAKSKILLSDTVHNN